ncbi:hypothetical protein [Massilia sp. TS11]|uniref:aggregation-promoting factor C-terminal-like domain-containing protein n=1 Tax=Massilia sp. TS11 TaxID=2908003 RepID=UPI001EDBE908|nr:hypothetical protein [Massilia sp. TS11]MCG2583521.1 hypothetical protein [Massilia sp. TS11]
MGELNVAKAGKARSHHTKRQSRPAKAEWTERNPASVPATVQSALKEALNIEKVSMAEYDDFLWIIAQESSGVVDARNPKSTARGLFQLLRAQYSLNPNGEKSFGNAVEECQGGIHYVLGRYHSASAAKRFWLAHHWY